MMTRRRLLLRNLRHFRAANLAVVAGMAVATAVLTGALLVGDSVRGSLRELALQRLGPVDFALVTPRFFDQSLADRLRADPSFAGELAVVPALLVRGGASDESGEHRTGGVQVAALGGDAGRWVSVDPGEVVINQTLADTLAIRAAGGGGAGSGGASIALNLPAPGDVPKDATLARRSADEVTARPQLRVERIASEPGLASMFSLEGGQRPTRNAWMHLADLQREIRQPGRANLLLASSKNAMLTLQQARLKDALRRVMTLDDLGLRLAPGGDKGEGPDAVLSSRTTYITPAVNAAAQSVADQRGIRLRRVSVQLINNVVRLDAANADAATIHYAVAAGISALDDGTLAPDEIALNEWTAMRLGAKVGDRIRLDYYQRRPDGELGEVRSDRPGVGLTFRVAKILPMTGLGADRSLTPEYPGLTDKATIREAPPELGINDDLLSDDDEAYWKQYRAAPKVFLNLDTARRLWGDAHGELTSIRLPLAQSADFERELLARIDPADMGMTFHPIKQQQLAAASGSTDFSMLFVGLSFFLIVSAGLLAAMLFCLSVEARARQFGVMEAIGFTPRALYRLALAEGFILACIGGVVGSVLGVGYTAVMVAGLRTWWVDAVGTTALRLHVEPTTLAIGFVAGLCVAMLAAAWAAWNLRKVEPVRLLSGAWEDELASAPLAATDATQSPPRKRRPRISAAIAIASLACGAAMLIAGGIGALSAQAAFFGGASLLLLGCLCGVAWALRSGPRRPRSADPLPARWSVGNLAIRTAWRHPARSLLTVCLIALASFLLVTVAAMRQGPPSDLSAKDTGTGGYRLILQADIPLLADLNTPAGREKLGMREPNAPVWSKARFTSLRRWAGQDASCLNLTRPDSPTILAVPDSMIGQERFRFASTISKVENPWTLLTAATKGASGEDVIPVIADNETAQYILKLSLGQELHIADQNGRPRRLMLVATLAGSMLQSELLMGEGNFRKLFPFQGGFGVVLIDTDAASAPEIARRLGQELDPFAVTVESTADRLAAYKQVANTYLSTFQTLGSLGLLLGTLGLAVVLLRGLIERRSELALLAAVGFRPSRRLGLVLRENFSLLLIGLIAGTACAVAGVLPATISSGQSIGWGGLSLALASVLFSGLIVLTLAAWLGGRRIAPADLRRE